MGPGKGQLRNCELILTEARERQAWQFNRTFFAVHTPRPTLFLLACPGMDIESQEILGYQLVWLQEGCRASSREVELVAGQEGENAATEITRSIVVANENEIFLKDTSEHLSLERPAQVHAIS